MVTSDFFTVKDKRVYKCKEPLPDTSDDECKSHSELSLSDIFECSEQGCKKSFKTFLELEAHLDVEDHSVLDF